MFSWFLVLCVLLFLTTAGFLKFSFLLFSSGIGAVLACWTGAFSQAAREAISQLAVRLRDDSRETFGLAPWFRATRHTGVTWLNKIRLFVSQVSCQGHDQCSRTKKLHPMMRLCFGKLEVFQKRPALTAANF